MRLRLASVWPAVLSLALLTVLPGADLTPVASAHPGWTVVASSEETPGAAANVIDGDPSTFWHSRFSGGSGVPAPFPHRLTLDTGQIGPVTGLALTPRQDGSPNGNLGQIRVEVSVNGSYWRNVAGAVLADTNAQKSVQFPPVNARFVRLIAFTEAGNRGTWSSLAELGLLTTAPAAPATGTGQWSLPINVPVVPVAATMLTTGKVLLWSSYKPDNYGFVGDPNDPGRTMTATLDPATVAISQRAVTETQHDMFCPGTALLPNGSLLVNGGSTNTKTSMYNPRTGVWSVESPLAIQRAYQTAVTLSTGAVFSLGGSWDDRAGNKHGELWTAAGGSQLVPGALVDPILTNDPEGVYRSDNHPWLFAAAGGKVFHAGPSKAMHWYDTNGNGSVTAAGPRAGDSDAMNGSAVMYDIGKVLAVGGAPGYQDSVATANAHTIDITGPSPVVTSLAPMASARAFTTGVVLPDGRVLVVGGQAYAKPYSDATAAMRPELWDPATGKFTEMAPMQVPRTYHSMAVLLPDGRVLAGGGGLCGATCDTNHPDVEIFTPPYLLNAEGAPLARPVISNAPTTAAAGAQVQVKTKRAVDRFALVRMSSVTHSVNSDQRRVPLTITKTAGTNYTLALPADHGVLVPGAYMLFALDGRGVPSIAKTVMIT